MKKSGGIVFWLWFVIISLSGTSVFGNGSFPKELLGYWTLDLSTNEPAWMRIEEKEGQPIVYMRVHVLGEGPHKGVKVENGRVVFPLKIKRQGKGEAFTTQNIVSVGLNNGKLEGLIVCESTTAPYNRITFTGKKVPPVGERPDLPEIRFGKPIILFNGKDLSGWRLHSTDRVIGWSVKDGILENNTPKTDFGSTGSYGNLETEAVFEDFYLHIEFLADTGQNSGVYLRGMYEAQVVDRDSRMQGLQGVGSVFGRVAPSRNAATEPGTWQTYDLTLVDRHMTVILNGVKVVDNQPIVAPTGGAVVTDPTAPGPILLQGDHTSIKYRNIYLAPVIKD